MNNISFSAHSDYMRAMWERKTFKSSPRADSFSQFMARIQTLFAKSWRTLSPQNTTVIKKRDVHRWSVNRPSSPSPYYRVLYAPFGFSHFAQAWGEELFLSFLAQTGGKWGQSVWSLFFWVSKELTVNITQELPWQVWVLAAAGCTRGVSLKNKTSVKYMWLRWVL